MECEEEAVALEHENNKSMIEEIKEYRERDAHMTRKVFRLFSVIWEAIVFFFS